jgi:c-di-GMP-binding flagellar brake protein YcgR
MATSLMKSEIRNFPRKIFRCQAKLALSGTAPVQARTVDISLGGLSLVVPGQLHIGQTCDVEFEAPLNGKTVRVIASGKVVYCIHGETDGFRIGLQFMQLDAAISKTLAELML